MRGKGGSVGKLTHSEAAFRAEVTTEDPRVTMGVRVGEGLLEGAWGAGGPEGTLEGEVETRWRRGTFRP